MWVVAARYEAGLGAPEDRFQAVRWLLQMMHRGNGDGFHEAMRIARGPGTKTVWCEVSGGDRTPPGEPSAGIRVDSAGMSVGVIAR